MALLSWCYLLGLASGLSRPRPLTVIPAAPALTRAPPALLTVTETAPAPLALPKLKPSKIRRGDYIVHQDYGIGRFEGLHQMRQSIQAADGTWVPEKALKVKFKDGTLDVPLTSKGDIKLFKRQEEVGEFETVRLDGMRSRKTWQNRKAKAAKNVIKVASELLTLYAERQELKREPCPPDGERMAKFASQFEFEPTVDQHRTFNEIEADMCQSERPMDRLVRAAHAAPGGRVAPE